MIELELAAKFLNRCFDLETDYDQPEIVELAELLKAARADGYESGCAEFETYMESQECLDKFQTIFEAVSGKSYREGVRDALGVIEGVSGDYCNEWAVDALGSCKSEIEALLTKGENE